MEFEYFYLLFFPCNSYFCIMLCVVYNLKTL